MQVVKFDKPDLIFFENDDYLEIYQYGDSFQSIFNGNKQKIIPFIGQSFDAVTLFTKIVVGFITEKDEVSFYGVFDYANKCIEILLLKRFEEAMKMLRGVKEITTDTCKECYDLVKEKY